jgi:hypothetical protein
MIPRRGALEVRARLDPVSESRGPAGQKPSCALRTVGKWIRTRVDDDQSAHALGMTGRKVDRVKPAHRVAHQERALDPRGVEHGERVGREVRGGIAIGGSSALAVAASVRRDERQTAADRICEKIPVTPVITDAMEEERWRPGAGPRPVDELGAVACDRVSRGHDRNTLPP